MTDNLAQLRERASGCTSCRLAQTRTNVVFGVGNPNARVMFIGEGPGQNEVEQGEPFVGRAGQLLDRMLGGINLFRDKNIYIANMVKCRPPENRDPAPDEVSECIGYLREQIKLIHPKILVCLGRIAAQYLITPDFKVTKQHGEFFERGDFLMMGTLHPAAILRNPGQKALAFEDFVGLRHRILELCPEVYEGIE